MTKKKLFFAVFAVIAVLFAVYFVKSSDKVIYGLSEGVYTAGVKGDVFAPRIVFDANEESFVFTYDLTMSYLNAGSYKIDGGKVKAVTNDGEFTYIFEIKDNDTLIFDKKSSVCAENMPVEDKTEFKFDDTVQ